MVFLVFDSPDHYAEVLRDTSFVKSTTPRFPVMANKSMLKCIKTKWDTHYPYVMVLRYRGGEIGGFKGKRILFSDYRPEPSLLDSFNWVDIYVKENSAPQPSGNLRVGAYRPSASVPWAIHRHPEIVEQKKKLDVFFCGQIRGSRKKKLHKITGKGVKIVERQYGRKKYLEMMAKARVCPSYTGLGKRCRREWEALLCNSLLMVDNDLKQYPFNVMLPDKHFVWDGNLERALDGEFEHIRQDGHELANRCFLSAPTIDIRAAAMYLFFDVPQLWTYEDVEEAEKRL